MRRAAAQGERNGAEDRPTVNRERTVSQTLFDKYGGFATVSRIVSAFYDEVLESEQLRPYFRGLDMRRLVDHQTKFIAALMGGGRRASPTRRWSGPMPTSTSMSPPSTRR